MLIDSRNYMNLNFDTPITNNKIKWQTAQPFNHLVIDSFLIDPIYISYID